MSRDSKRKLAIVAGISECLFYAEAKYCAFEIHGEPKYYVCPRTEYCCNFGCCVSPGFQIYHLWYYWLLVIIMFLVCSGGGWWYRYWLQGRYRAAASAIPSRGTTNSRGQSTLPGRTCPAQQASITYNSARNTVLLHRMWKGGPGHRGPSSSPAYTGPAVGGAASSAHFQNTSVVLNDVNCPYYQLYGPPPSYETVIAQTRGKLSSPLSPEHINSSRNVDLTTAATGSTMTMENQDVASSRCYNNHSSLPYNNNNNNSHNNNSNNSNHPSQTGSTIGRGVLDDAIITSYEQNNTNVTDTIRRIESSEASSGNFPLYPPSYVSDSATAAAAAAGNETTPVHTAGRQEACLPFIHYRGGPIQPVDYDQGHAALVPDTYRIYHDPKRLPSYRAERNLIDDGSSAIRANAQPSSSSNFNECDDDDDDGDDDDGDDDHHNHQIRRSSRQALAGESHSSVPDLNVDICDNNDVDSESSRKDRLARYSAGNHGGSLKFSRTRDDNVRNNWVKANYRRDRNNLGIGSISPISNEEGSQIIARTGNNVTRSSSSSSSSNGNKSRTTSAVETELSGATCSFSRSMRKGLLASDNGRENMTNCCYDGTDNRQQQTNPSDNVILEPAITSVTINEAECAVSAAESTDREQRVSSICWRTRRQNADETRRGRVLPSSAGAADEAAIDDVDRQQTVAVEASINNHESKHNKLDRSKSLG